jgi:hypothetical protein
MKERKTKNKLLFVKIKDFLNALRWDDSEEKSE